MFVYACMCVCRVSLLCTGLCHTSVWICVEMSVLCVGVLLPFMGVCVGVSLQCVGVYLYTGVTPVGVM